MPGVVNRFKERALERGGLLLFRPQDATSVVHELEKEQVRVLGLDAFYVTDHTTQPRMDNSVDLSSTAKPWDDATRFLQERIRSNLLFEIVADE